MPHFFRRGKFVLLLLIVCTAALLAVSFAPKFTLRSALINTFHQLEERFCDHPLRFLVDGMDSEGKYTVYTTWHTQTTQCSDILWDMTVNLDLAASKLLSDGYISLKGQSLDLSLYLDRNMMALRSDQFMQGTYYAIPYDSFLTDIRSIPLLSVFLRDSLFLQWDSKIQNLKTAMNTDVPHGSIPQLPKEWLNGLLAGVIVLPCETEIVPCWFSDEERCRKLTYNISGAQFEEIIPYTGGDREVIPDNATVSFYLRRKKLIQTDIEVYKGEESLRCSILLQENAARGKLGIRCMTNAGGKTREFSAFSNSSNRANQISESWEIYADYYSSVPKAYFSYRWEKQSGSLEWNWMDRSTMNMNLQKTENGIFFSASDIAPIVTAVKNGEERDTGWLPSQIRMEIRKGGSSVITNFKTLNQWSLEELLTILSVLEPVMGWKFS